MVHRSNRWNHNRCSKCSNNNITYRNPLYVLLFVLTILIVIVTIGTIGYHIYGGLNWLDSFHNGALVFTATSLVTPVNTYEGVIFSAVYNLFSTIFILAVLVVLIAAIFVDNFNNSCIDCDNNSCDDN